MRNVSDLIVEKIKMHILYSRIFSSENRAIYEITWKIIGRSRQSTDEKTRRRMPIACVMTKATDAHSEYVILFFHGNSGYAHAPEFIRKLPVVLQGC